MYNAQTDCEQIRSRINTTDAGHFGRVDLCLYRWRNAHFPGLPGWSTCLETAFQGYRCFQRWQKESEIEVGPPSDGVTRWRQCWSGQACRHIKTGLQRYRVKIGEVSSEATGNTYVNPFSNGGIDNWLTNNWYMNIVYINYIWCGYLHSVYNMLDDDDEIFVNCIQKLEWQMPTRPKRLASVIIDSTPYLYSRSVHLISTT